MERAPSAARAADVKLQRAILSLYANNHGVESADMTIAFLMPCQPSIGNASGASKPTSIDFGMARGRNSATFF